MTPKFVTSLAIATAISVAGAVFAYQANNVFVPQAGAGEVMLAGFEKKINDVASIEVKKGKTSIVLVHKAGVWQVKKSGFPVSPSKVRQALVGLAQLSKLEAKTANKDKYLLIDVDRPGLKDGRGRQFILSSAGGQTLGNIILGKTIVGKAGPGRDAQYARLGGQATSWLVLGAVTASTDLGSWVEPRFLEIDVDSVTFGRVMPAGGEKIEVRRTGKSETGSSIFELLDIAEGKKPRTSTTIKFVATDLVNLDMIDVRPKKAGTTPVSKAEITTDTGLKLAFSMVEENGKGWVSLEVVEKGKDVKKAEEIAARTKGWEFQVAGHKKAAFKRVKADLYIKEK